jgi:methylmalonyl-CoA mutase N-terminal domain/subunit
MKEKFQAKDERSMLLRFHTQTGGSTLTAQQPENNIVRTTVQALAAILGGTQSLHTNSFDEALGLPTEKAAEIALRTQQLLASESGVGNSVDPLGGSYLVEYLTDEIEQKAVELMSQIESKGGSVACVENGWFRDEIARSAYRYQKEIEQGEAIVVGVNKFKTEQNEIPTVLKLDPALERKQIESLQAVKSRRDKGRVQKSLERLKDASVSDENLVGPVLEAIEQYATVGEISDVFRNLWGEYHARG